ncbi:uncharacterized protein LOC134796940 [Cydia splendana]|uniref:uncharacterized protein LOC134796940 n=1 Tax=Cydia splendana TaxID=1100963 RepID=UPI00300C4AB1
MRYLLGVLLMVSSVLCDRNDSVENSKLGRSYRLMYNAATWQDAKQTCLNNGGKLAVPKSQDEFSVIQGLIRKMHYPSIIGWTGSRLLAWVGISNVEEPAWKNVDGLIRKMHYPSIIGWTGSRLLAWVGISNVEEPAWKNVDGLIRKMHYPSIIGWTGSRLLAWVGISNVEEPAWKNVDGLIRKMHYPSIIGWTGSRLLAWVGISNVEEPVWKNVDGEDIENTGFATWAKGNGDKSSNPKEPHCAVMDAANPGLRSYWCHYKQPFVCESHLNP